MSEPVWVPLGAAPAALASKDLRPIQLSTPHSTTLAGNAFWGVTAFTDSDIGRWEFLKDVDGMVTGICAIPPSLATSPAPKIRLALTASIGGGVSRMEVATRKIADATHFGTALLLEPAVDVALNAVANVQKVVEVPLTQEVMTPGGILVVRIAHRGAHANDTATGNTLLFGAWLETNI